jgi:low affinity Fe/Cu permease
MTRMVKLSRVAHATARGLGTTKASIVAILFIVAWALAGPVMQYSDTWHHIFSYGTGISTFVMVFLMQNTQNRDTDAMQLKLDELIRVTDFARNRLVNIENNNEDEVREIKESLIRAAQFGGVGMVELEEAQHDLDDSRREIKLANDMIDDAEQKTGQ